MQFSKVSDKMGNDIVSAGWIGTGHLPVISELNLKFSFGLFEIRMNNFR